MISWQSWGSLGTYTRPLHVTRSLSLSHSSDQSMPAPSSRSALTTVSSWSVLLQIHSTNSLPLLSTRVASVFCTSNTSEGSRVMLALSSLPQGWSDLCDSTLGLPINCPGWWWREKLKHKRKRDQCACQQLSFCVSQK